MYAVEKDWSKWSQGEKQWPGFPSHKVMFSTSSFYSAEITLHIIISPPSVPAEISHRYLTLWPAKNGKMLGQLFIVLNPEL